MNRWNLEIKLVFFFPANSPRVLGIIWQARSTNSHFCVMCPSLRYLLLAPCCFPFIATSLGLKAPRSVTSTISDRRKGEKSPLPTPDVICCVGWNNSSQACGGGGCVCRGRIRRQNGSFGLWLKRTSAPGRSCLQSNPDREPPWR